YNEKSQIFEQALMQAMDLVHHPERTNQTFFRIQCELHPDHENRASADKYCLKFVDMAPLDQVPSDIQPGSELSRIVKELDDQVKSRGQIGAIPVMMVDGTDPDCPAFHWWVLAIPYSTKAAQKILENTKWGNVWWVSLSPPRHTRGSGKFVRVR
ncbi:hypothetical protein MPER_08554, partial [Moniliophthora perniciosa FA553]